MTHALHLLVRNFVGNNRQSLIQLHGIPVDDFAIVFACYLDRQLPGVMSDGFERAIDNAHTSDLPVPVAPTITTRGLAGALAILPVLRCLIVRNMHLVVFCRMMIHQHAPERKKVAMLPAQCRLALQMPSPLAAQSLSRRRRRLVQRQRYKM
jgi:hypothetical protein